MTKTTTIACQSGCSNFMTTMLAMPHQAWISLSIGEEYTTNKTDQLTHLAITDLEESISEFFAIWNFFFPSSDTPYIHIVCRHAAEMANVYGSIGV